MLTLKLKRVMKTGVFAVSFGIASTPIVMSSSARLEPVEAVDVAHAPSLIVWLVILLRLVERSMRCSSR
jgi:hypothetical protein